jgi:hypothetical protein
MKDKQKKFKYICTLTNEVKEKHNLATSHLFALENELSDNGECLHKFAARAKVNDVWVMGLEKFIRVK